MWTFCVRLSAIAVAILIVSFANRPAYARGSYVGHDDPWNSERIDLLPPEVRNVVIHICANPRAGHYFATYFDNSHLIKLHFEYLHCDERVTFCREAVVSVRNIFLPAAAIGSLRVTTAAITTDPFAPSRMARKSDQIN